MWQQQQQQQRKIVALAGTRAGCSVGWGGTAGGNRRQY